MTNYNERLDEVLFNLVNQVAANEQRLLNGNATREETIDSDSNAIMRAKQAITSLIKELVAEAKPSKKHVGDEIAENRSYTGERLFNATIDEYHNNLLKVLGGSNGNKSN